jgi:hypothetical protein
VRADGVKQGRGAHRKERRTSFRSAEYDGRSTVGPWLDPEGEVRKELINRLRNLHLGCPEVSSCPCSP